ncbi:MAG: zinc dependent phospholipase C family protein [Bacillota bacterium]
MMINTHRTIGKMMYDYTMEKLGFMLDEKSLKYGCIKPDIKSKYRAIPHYIETSFHYVLRIIKELSAMEIPNTKKELKSFSEKLGIALHYIADYFCYAHNSCEYEFLPVHLIYEKNLGKYISEHGIMERCMENASWLDFSEGFTDAWTNDYLLSLHSSYMMNRAGMKDDAIYAVTACMVITYTIISTCAENVRRKAA